MNRNHIKGVLTTLSLCLVLLLAIGAASYAWFINNGEAGVRTDDNVVITVDNRLEIRPVGSEDESWHAILTQKQGGTYPDITGDGLHFYFPTTLTADDEPVYDDLSTFAYVNNLSDRDLFYMTLKIEFRSRIPMDVYLAEGSFVGGMDMATLDDLSESVSSDLIAGAVRVSFAEEKLVDGKRQEELKVVWIPNDHYQLIVNDDGSFDWETGSTVTEAYGYLTPNNGTLDDSTEMVWTTWSESDYTSGRVVVGEDGLATTGNPNGCRPLLSLNGRETKTLVIRIWIEGTDNEANSTLNGGYIKYNLNFVGVMPSESE